MKETIYNGHCLTCGETFIECNCDYYKAIKFIKEDGYEDESEYVYFLEDQYTGHWLTPDGRLSADPLSALSFEKRAQANIYKANKGYSDLVVTEHLFL